MHQDMKCLDKNPKLFCKVDHFDPNTMPSVLASNISAISQQKTITTRKMALKYTSEQSLLFTNVSRSAQVWNTFYSPY